MHGQHGRSGERNKKIGGLKMAQNGPECHYKAMCVHGGGGEKEERKGGQVQGVVRRDRGLKSEQPHQSKCTPPQIARYGPLRHNDSVMQP